MSMAANSVVYATRVDKVGARAKTYRAFRIAIVVTYAVIS